jgi:lipopolysaccharide transport system permease protein
MNEVVYSSEPDLLNPVRFVRAMFHDLTASWELAWRLFVRDFNARYRQTLLGYVWAFLPPLATTIPFIFLKSQGLLTTGETSIPYPAYVMVGMLFWQLFVDAVQSPLKAVTAAKPILSKVQFPPEAILMAGIGEVLFSFVIRLLLLILVFGWYRSLPPVTALLTPVVVTSVVVLGFMVGLLVTPLGILYEDFTPGLALGTTFWLFFTPVVYPAQRTGAGALITSVNPVSPLIIVGRDWLTTGVTNQFTAFAAVSVGSIVLLLAAWICYRVALPHLVARIGN